MKRDKVEQHFRSAEDLSFITWDTMPLNNNSSVKRALKTNLMLPAKLQNHKEFTFYQLG